MSKINPRSIMVATPMYGGMCTAAYTESMLNLMALCIQSNVSLTYAFMSNESLIVRARNTLANMFMRETNCSHLVFIDSDIGFTANDVIKLMLHDKDIVCGVYSKKEINWKAVKDACLSGAEEHELKRYGGSMALNLINFGNKADVKDGDLLEVKHGATGFMMIKRGVFETMNRSVNKYLHPQAMLGSDLNTPGNFHYEYFACSIHKDTGLFLSEDYHFCEFAASIGIKTYLDPSIKLTHTGTYLYEGGFIMNKNDQ